MGLAFRKEQIVSSKDLVRSFGKYLKEDVPDHDVFILKHNEPKAVLVDFERYEEMREKFDELRELLEHLVIYDMVEQRKDSPKKEIPFHRIYPNRTQACLVSASCFIDGH